MGHQWGVGCTEAGLSGLQSHIQPLIRVAGAEGRDGDGGE